MKKLYKKISLAFVSILALTIILAIPVFAYSNNPITDYVTDDADILTDEEEVLLEEKIDNIRKTLDYDIVIHTTETFDNKSKVAYADDYYDYNGFSKDGMIFVVNMVSRDFYTSTCGIGIDTFTDDVLEEIEKTVQPYLSSGEYYKAFDNYLNQCRDELSNHSIKNSIFREDAVLKILCIVLVSFIIALIITLVLKGKMSNVHIEKTAGIYEVPNTLNIYGSRDMFMYKHIDKHKIESSSGGGSSHRSSSGRSHGGHGGKF